MLLLACAQQAGSAASAWMAASVPQCALESQRSPPLVLAQRPAAHPKYARSTIKRLESAFQPKNAQLKVDTAPLDYVPQRAPHAAHLQALLCATAMVSSPVC